MGTRSLLLLNPERGCTQYRKQSLPARSAFRRTRHQQDVAVGPLGVVQAVQAALDGLVEVGAAVEHLGRGGER